MSFPKYPAYKESGVEWIGKVPVGWNIKSIKRVAQLHTEKSNNRIFPVALENIQSKTGKFIPSDTEFEGEGVSFQKGDILFGKLRPYLAKVWLADKAGEAVGDFHVISPISCNGDFLRWLLISDEVISQIDGSTFGAKMPRASWDFISQFSVPLPSVSEQQAIARFLDRECGKIDALIAEQERLIALLVEKRQAVLSHAVTKGLNPNAPIKDSGIPWIGMVPEGWEVKPLYQVCSKIMTGPFGTVLGNEDYIENGVPVINPSHIFSGKFRPDISVSVLPSKANELNNWKLNENDVICARRGEIGRAALVNKSEQGWICGTGSIIIRPNENFILGAYIKNLIGSDFSKSWLQLEAVGSTMLNLNEKIIGKLPVVIPSLTEQKEINIYIKKIETIHNCSLENAKNMITLLKERRAALISAAVTGKIDVRAQSKAIAA